MFIHIGANRSVRENDIIGVFDIESASQSAVTKTFLKTAQKDGRVEDICGDLPKSIVLTVNGVIVSPSAAGSIKKRTRRNTERT